MPLGVNYLSIQSIPPIPNRTSHSIFELLFPPSRLYNN